MSQRFQFDPRNKNALPGLILIVLGVLGLFGTLGVLAGIGGLFGALLFGGLAYFAYVEGKRSGNIVMRLAALPLAGLAIATIVPGGVGGAAFLASIGAAFGVVWYLDARRWWALIPAGTLLSLALVAFLDATLGGSNGSIFLLGLAATFFALTRLRVEPQTWGIYPAAGLAVLALVSFTTGGRWVVPVVLIGVGAYLLMRSGNLRLPTIERQDAAPGGFVTKSETTPMSEAPAAPSAPEAESSAESDESRA
ncbi:MAG: hypothetical protein R6W77_14650 [Trueperaceae bacterium]